MLLKNDDVVQVEPLTVNARVAAKMLGVCERTVRNLTKRGELPVIRMVGCVRYSRESLIDYVRQRSMMDTSNSSASVSEPHINELSM